MNVLELNPNTERYRILRDAIRARIRAGRNKLSSRRAKWEESEKLYMAYQPETEEEASRRGRREEGVPQYTTVVIPYSYATLLAAHTYWTSVFLSRDPIFQFTARHGETQQQVQAVEALIAYQVQVGRMLPVLFSWLLDAGKYGIGIIGNFWDSQIIKKTSIVKRPKEFMGIPIPDTEETVRETVTVKGYEGNQIYNIRPQDFFYDPRVSATNIQKGEYCGRTVYVGWNTVVRGQARGEYFNIDLLPRGAANFFDSGRDRGADLQELPDDVATLRYSRGDADRGTKPQVVALTELVWELIPAEWKLGSSTYPEKWVFTLAYDDIIIGARPLDALHDQFPFFIQSYEYDPYVYSGRGMLEVLKPLNDILDWLFNSHMFNVRRVLNDNLVVDPSRVTMRDLREGGPGRIIRVAPTAYGTDPRSAVHQLAVVDITAQHLRSFQVVVDLFQRVTGVNDNLMGLVNVGGRKSATEIRTSANFGINRLKALSEYNSALGWAPLAQVLLQNSQQFYDGEMKLRIAGDLLAGQEDRWMQITPDIISGFYDFVPVDGTLPVDRFAQANLWKEVLLGMQQMPQIAASYDVAGIFQWMAQLAGLKNITQFRVQTQPDAQIMANLQAGNIRPMSGVPGTPELQGIMQ